MDAYEEIVLIGDLTHPRITPIEEVRGNDEGIAVVYQSNAGNLKGKVTVVSRFHKLLAPHYHFDSRN